MQIKNIFSNIYSNYNAGNQFFSSKKSIRLSLRSLQVS